MATPNPPTPSVADAEPRPATGQDGRRELMVYWMEYTLTGSTVAATAGGLMVLWGGAQDSVALLLSGAALFLLGFLGWMGVFIFMTWQVGRWLVPLLVGRLLKGVRKLLPKDGPNIVEK